MMEVFILRDVMNAVTLLKKDPKVVSKALSEHNGDLFDYIDDRYKFAQLLDEVKEPMHPTDVFDMIVGTSTGES